MDGYRLLRDIEETLSWQERLYKSFVIWSLRSINATLMNI